MVSNSINTRADLDAIAGTPAHQEAMAMLRGTLWRLEKDDAAKTWRAVADDSIIARFGFVRTDFPSAAAPALPQYQGPDIAAPIKAHAAEIILAKYPLWVQINYANGVYPTADADVMKAAIASVIAESNRCEDIIAVGGTPTPNWPTL